jgi:hypothetical protein
MLVVPFQNLTRDPQVAKDVQDQFVARVLQLAACQVGDLAQVQSILDQYKRSPASVETDLALRNYLVKATGSDVIFIATVNNYQDSIQEQAPSREVDKKGQGTWSVYQQKNATTTVSGKLIDAKTGSILWMKSIEGTVGSTKYFNIDSWSGDKTGPPHEWYPFLCQAIPGYATYRTPPVWHDNSDNKELKVGFLTLSTGTKRENPYRDWAAQYKPDLPLVAADPGMGDIRKHSVDHAVGKLFDDFNPHGGWYPGIVLDEKGNKVEKK